DPDPPVGVPLGGRGLTKKNIGADPQHDPDGHLRPPARGVGDETGRRHQLVHPVAVHGRGADPGDARRRGRRAGGPRPLLRDRARHDQDRGQPGEHHRPDVPRRLGGGRHLHPGGPGRDRGGGGGLGLRRPPLPRRLTPGPAGPDPRSEQPAAGPTAALDTVAEWPVPHAAVAAARLAPGGPARLLGTSGPEHRVFPWASVTKPATALAVLVAVEEGTLGLDQPAGPPGSTVRHLLAHASGLSYRPGPPVAPPGRARIYSNAAYRVLADILAERARMP